MRRKEEIEAYAENLFLPITQKHGFELVDVEYVKEGGIAVDDCEVVSREADPILDADDCIEESYILEVSSPGLGRPLKKEKDYIRSMGKELEIRTYRAIDREKEFYGILKAYDADTVTIEQEDGKEMVFEKSNIALIRLAFDF